MRSRLFSWVCVAMIALGVYIFWTSIRSGGVEEVRESPVLSQAIREHASGEGVRVHSGILASPFGSGTVSDTEEVAADMGQPPPRWYEKPHISARAPTIDLDLSWPDQVHSVNGQTLVYRFGEGNPKEVHPSCCEISDEYATAEREIALRDFLVDERVRFTMTACPYVFMDADSYQEALRSIRSRYSLQALIEIDDYSGRKSTFDRGLYFSFRELVSVPEQEGRWRNCLTPEEYASLRSYFNAPSSVFVRYAYARKYENSEEFKAVTAERAASAPE